MALPEHILLTYGYLLLFAWVLVEQLGIPLPATPVLLAAGALSAENEISFPLALMAALVGSLMADSSWFLVGRRYGHYVMRFLCKLSLEPTACVRRTQAAFGRRRGVTLLFAKFVPGLSLLAAPVAGQNGMSFGSFLFFDVIGVTLWVGALLTAGRFFGDLLLRNQNLLDLAGRFSGALLILGIIAFLVVRIVRRRMIIKKLVAARLEPEELKKQIDAGEPVYIVDLRHPRELLSDPFTLAGALLFSPDTLAARHLEIPRDRDVVLFCSCPNEAAAAKTAMTLHKLGIERVRPLRGGYDEWKRLGFPLAAVEAALPAQSASTVTA
ncbi:MAG: VTT domain-containing protein [Terracidiphilus sp.]|jgi:membrane protein DedA with SNARE-associated domain/rhodanese-related sulfurtransferase